MKDESQFSDLYACIDLGTQSVRVGIIDEHGTLVACAEHEYPISYPNDGWAEQKPEDWYKNFLLAWESALKDISPPRRKCIKALCACATSSTVFPVDAEGRPLSNALVWMDSRAVKEAEDINATGNPTLSHCGGEVSVEWLIPKVLWFKHNKKEIYDTAYRFVEQLDWFNWMLSGEWCSSECNATCKANYSHDDGGWNPHYFGNIGLDDYKEKIITQVTPVGGLIGELRADFCETYGLNKSVSLYQGGIDAYIAVLGLGVVHEGILGAILGTSFVELCMTSNPLKIEGIWGPYKDAIIEGYYTLEGGQISAGSITKWFREIFGNGKSIDFKSISSEAKNSGVGAHGLVALDFFQGNRTPYKNPKSRGVIWGLSLSHSRGDIYRALIESVAFGTRNIISNFNLFGYDISSIVACGGVTKDELWMSVIADACDMQISLVNSSSYAGLMGCAMISAVSSGLFRDYVSAANSMIHEVAVVEPDHKNKELYESAYDQYIALCGIMNSMTSKK